MGPKWLWLPSSPSSDLPSPSLTPNVHHEAGVKVTSPTALMGALWGSLHLQLPPGSVDWFWVTAEVARMGKGSEKSPGMESSSVLFNLVFLDCDKWYKLMVRSTGLGARLSGINLYFSTVILDKLVMLPVLQFSHL